MTKLRALLLVVVLAFGTIGVGVVAAPEPADAITYWTFTCGNYDRWGHLASAISTNPTTARTNCINQLNAMEACIDWTSFWYQSGPSYVYRGWHFSDKWWCGTGYHTLAGGYV